MRIHPGTIRVALLVAVPAAGLMFAALPGGAGATAGDSISQSLPAQWQVNGNGSIGTLEIETSFGTQVSGRLYGDTVNGYLTGRHLVLFREGRSEQVWDGWIMDPRGPNRRDRNFSDGLFIAGTYSDGGDTYPWYAVDARGSSSGVGGRGRQQDPGQQPQGWLDTANCEVIEGWARDPDDTSALVVRLYVDGPSGSGQSFGSAVAGNFRGDLPFRDKNHGYSIRVPQGLKDGRPHAIYMYALDPTTGIETLLEGSPKMIQCGGM